MKQPAENTPDTIHIYNDPNEDLEDDLRPEYDFAQMESKPNPYAERALRRKAIILEKDIAEVFTNSEQVNKALRAIFEAVPTRSTQEKAA